jgi:tetratricopeptide (TPR) repeat protein
MHGRLQGARFGRAVGGWIGFLAACTIASAEVGAQAPASDRTADGPPSSGYAQAINEAVGHYSAGRWLEAQAAFGRAHAMQPSARTYRGLGLAAFYLDEFATARQAFEQALADDRKPLAEDQRRELADLLEVCARQTGRIELRVAPASARVELDGVATDRRVLFLARGEHVLAVSAEGHLSERARLTIAGGEQRSLELTLASLDPREAVAPAVAEPASPSEPAREAAISPGKAPTADASKSGRPRVLTWIAAAAVPVFAGTAAAVWLTGEAARDEIEEECAVQGCDKRETQRRFDDAGLDAHETWTNVSLVASGIALAAAVVLFVVEGEAASGSSSVEVSATGSQATLHGRF